MSLDVYLKVPRESHEEGERRWDGPDKCCCDHKPTGDDPGGSCVWCIHCNAWFRPHLRDAGCPSAKRIYDSNITHNLNTMAEAAGIYKACWRPDEIGITKAKQLIPLLRDGLAKLEADPKKYEAYNSPNGWGLYRNFVPWVRSYLSACIDNPEADVEVSR